MMLLQRLFDSKPGQTLETLEWHRATLGYTETAGICATLFYGWASGALSKETEEIGSRAGSRPGSRAGSKADPGNIGDQHIQDLTRELLTFPAQQERAKQPPPVPTAEAVASIAAAA